MKLFLILFFTVYIALHYYVYRRVTSSIRLSSRIKAAVVILLLLGVLSPPIWRFLDREGFSELAHVVAFAGLMWMGFVIYFFLIGILIDLLAKIRPLKPRRKLLIVICLTLSIGIYSHIETYFLQVNRFVIETEKLPKGITFKVMNVSDLHLGPVMREGRIEMVRRVFFEEKPDILVATGDTVDGNMQNFNDLADMLLDLKPPLGKFAVIGNHEYYAGLKQSIRFLQRAGFRVLRGEAVDVGKYLSIAGVDDSEGERLGYKVFTEELKVLKRTDRNRFVILLKHKPKVNREAVPYFDLQLSGHTHGGVLFFVGYTLLRLIFETDRGIKKIAPGKFIIVSKGVGTGGPPMRLLSPPDVVIVSIKGISTSIRSEPQITLSQCYQPQKN